MGTPQTPPVTQGVSPSTVPSLTPDWVPAQFVIGTTVKFTRTFADSPACAWKYTIYWNSPQKNNQDGVPYPVPGSTGFLMEVPSSVTESLQPRPYRYCERVTALEADDQGQIEIFDLSGDMLVTNMVVSRADSPANFLLTGQAQTLLVVNAAIAGTVSDSIQGYQIAGRGRPLFDCGSAKTTRHVQGRLVAATAISDSRLNWEGQNACDG